MSGGAGVTAPAELRNGRTVTDVHENGNVKADFRDSYPFGGRKVVMFGGGV